MAPMLTTGAGGYPAISGGSDAAQTTAFLVRADAITTVGSTERAAYKTLINGMVTDGDFALLDFFYIFATDTSAHALLDLTTGAHNATNHGATFTADVGFTGDASTAWIDSGVNLSTLGGNASDTSECLGVYIPATGTRATGQAWVAIGAQSSTASPYHSIYPKFTDNNAYSQYSGNASFAMTNAKGLTVGLRTSTSAMALWKYDGTNAGSVASGTATDIMPNVTTAILASNRFGGSQLSNSGDIVAAAFAGSGAINVANVAARINTFMTAVGANAY